MNKKLEISIIIPTYNRKNEVLNILTDISKQNTRYVLKVFLVVDGSTDGTSEAVAKHFPNTKIIQTKGQYWYTRSINEGFKHAAKSGSDFLLTMNDDCRLESNYIKLLMNGHKQIGIKDSIVGSMSFSVEEPKRVIFSGVKKITWWRFKVEYYIPKNTAAKENYSGVYPSESLPGRGILIPMNVYETIGGFDNSFVQYYSDSEFIFRARKYGYRTFVCWDAKVYTYLSKTGKGSAYSDESVLTFLKNFVNPYSRNNWKNIARIIWRYGTKWLFPFTFALKIAGHFKNYFRGKE